MIENEEEQSQITKELSELAEKRFRESLEIVINRIKEKNVSDS